MSPASLRFGFSGLDPDAGKGNCKVRKERHGHAQMPFPLAIWIIKNVINFSLENKSQVVEKGRSRKPEGLHKPIPKHLLRS
jgi:hypothetical protein